MARSVFRPPVAWVSAVQFGKEIGHVFHEGGVDGGDSSAFDEVHPEFTFVANHDAGDPVGFAEAIESGFDALGGAAIGLDQPFEPCSVDFHDGAALGFLQSRATEPRQLEANPSQQGSIAVLTNTGSRGHGASQASSFGDCQ